MKSQKAHSASVSSTFINKVKAIGQLFKLRLSSLVVFSAVLGYLVAAAANGTAVQFMPMLWLALGGVLVTGASNAINQVIERDIDALMERTMNRPIPTGVLSVLESLVAAGLAGVSGILLLSLQFSPLVGLLAAISLISYAFIYTPMKRLSVAAGYVGAIPGALPPMIGAVAVTGEMTYLAFVLFAIQFIWQFPHFWAIAWLQDADYSKVGIRLLPASGKTRKSATIILAYTALLIFLPILFYIQGLIGVVACTALVLGGVFFTLKALNLYKEVNDEAAKQLMFASFWYLPLFLVTFYLDALL